MRRAIGLIYTPVSRQSARPSVYPSVRPRTPCPFLSAPVNLLAFGPGGSFAERVRPASTRERRFRSRRGGDDDGARSSSYPGYLKQRRYIIIVSWRSSYNHKIRRHKIKPPPATGPQEAASRPSGLLRQHVYRAHPHVHPSTVRGTGVGGVTLVNHCCAPGLVRWGKL